MKMLRSALLTIALSAGFAAPGSAGEADQPRTIVVKYGDLDLTSAAGASLLYQRFKHAAWKVCKKPDGAFGDPAAFLHCYHEALARAVGELSNATVTQLYNGEHKDKALPPVVTARMSR